MSADLVLNSEDVNPNSPFSRDGYILDDVKVVQIEVPVDGSSPKKVPVFDLSPTNKIEPDIPITTEVLPDSFKYFHILPNQIYNASFFLPLNVVLATRFAWIFNLYSYFRYDMLVRIDIRPPLGVNHKLKFFATAKEDDELDFFGARGVTIDTSKVNTIYLKVPWLQKEYLTNDPNKIISYLNYQEISGIKLIEQLSPPLNFTIAVCPINVQVCKYKPPVIPGAGSKGFETVEAQLTYSQTRARWYWSFITLGVGLVAEAFWPGFGGLVKIGADFVVSGVEKLVSRDGRVTTSQSVNLQVFAGCTVDCFTEQFEGKEVLALKITSGTLKDKVYYILDRNGKIANVVDPVENRKVPIFADVVEASDVSPNIFTAAVDLKNVEPMSTKFKFTANSLANLMDRMAASTYAVMTPILLANDQDRIWPTTPKLYQANNVVNLRCNNVNGNVELQLNNVNNSQSRAVLALWKPQEVGYQIGQRMNPRFVNYVGNQGRANIGMIIWRDAQGVFAFTMGCVSNTEPGTIYTREDFAKNNVVFLNWRADQYSADPNQVIIEWDSLANIKTDATGQYYDPQHYIVISVSAGRDSTYEPVTWFGNVDAKPHSGASQSLTVYNTPATQEVEIVPSTKKRSVKRVQCVDCPSDIAQFKSQIKKVLATFDVMNHYICLHDKYCNKTFVCGINSSVSVSELISQIQRTIAISVHPFDFKFKTVLGVEDDSGAEYRVAHFTLKASKPLDLHVQADEGISPGKANTNDAGATDLQASTVTTTPAPLTDNANVSTAQPLGANYVKSDATENIFIPLSKFNIKAAGNTITSIINPQAWVFPGSKSFSHAQIEAIRHVYVGPNKQKKFCEYKVTSSANAYTEGRLIVVHIPPIYTLDQVKAFTVEELCQFPRREHRLHGTETVFQIDWVNPLPVIDSYSSLISESNGYLVISTLELNIATTSEFPEVTLWVRATDVKYEIPRNPRAFVSVFREDGVEVFGPQAEHCAFLKKAKQLGYVPLTSSN